MTTPAATTMTTPAATTMKTSAATNYKVSSLLRAGAPLLHPKVIERMHQLDKKCNWLDR